MPLCWFRCRRHRHRHASQTAVCAFTHSLDSNLYLTAYVSKPNLTIQVLFAVPLSAFHVSPSSRSIRAAQVKHLRATLTDLAQRGCHLIVADEAHLLSHRPPLASTNSASGSTQTRSARCHPFHPTPRRKRTAFASVGTSAPQALFETTTMGWGKSLISILFLFGMSASCQRPLTCPCNN